MRCCHHVRAPGRCIPSAVTQNTTCRTAKTCQRKSTLALHSTALSQPVVPYCVCVFHMTPSINCGCFPEQHIRFFTVSEMYSYLHDKTWYSLLFMLICVFKASVVTSRLLTAEARLHFRPVYKIFPMNKEALEQVSIRGHRSVSTSPPVQSL